MSEKSGDNVMAPVHDPKNIHSDNDTPTTKDDLNSQHHGENQKSLQDDKKIGQHNGAGRPPLMKK